MRPLVAIFLLAIFLFNTVGYFLSFRVVRYHVRREVKRQIERGLPEDQLSMVEIREKDRHLLIWHKEGREFSFKGRMYDIVRERACADGTVIYQCIMDTHEEALFANLEDHIDRHISDNKPIRQNSAKKIMDHVAKLFYFTATMTACGTEIHVLSFPVDPSLPFSSEVKETTTPPPERG